mgnify:CR=1 FL=1
MAYLWYFLERLPEFLGYLTMVLTGLMGVFALIPGDQPEKFIKDTLLPLVTKFSRK